MVGFKKARVCVFVMWLLFCECALAQAVGQDTEGDTRFTGVRLTFISQRSRRVGRARRGSRRTRDSFGVFRDDIRVRFRLANEGERTVYYLAPLNSREPVGYMHTRQEGATQWRVASPDRGREHLYRGYGYRWLPLRPGTVFEFEFSGLRSQRGEHAISILLNTRPNHRDRVEFFSDAYRPLGR